MRAFRARQRGEPEPPVLAVALDDGDELAAAWEQIRLLGRQLDDRREVERSLRNELRAGRNALTVQEQRYRRLRAENDELRAQLSELKERRRDQVEQSAALVPENRDLRQRLREALTALEERTAEPGGRLVDGASNRAQRRRAAKETWRRSR
jgi:hypothetical protein